MNLELLLHNQIKSFFEQNGFKFSTDYWDNTPTGEEWNADFVTHNYANDKQLVIKTLWLDGMLDSEKKTAIENAKKENAMFLSSGYQSLWLISLNADNYEDIRKLQQQNQCASMPLFYFYYDKANTQQFYFGGWRSNAERDNNLYYETTQLISGVGVSNFFSSKDETRWLTLVDFIKSYSKGVLRWNLSRVETAVSLALIERPCWKCNKLQNVIKRVNLIGYPFPEKQNLTCVWHYSNLEDSPLDPEIIKKLNNPKVREKYNYGFIAERYSKTVKYKYLSTGCVKCGALQGQHFINMFVVNPQDCTHTDLIEAGELITDPETYENQGDWIYLGNELFAGHKNRILF